MSATTDGGPPRFDYAQAFSRNIGWVTPEEQERLRRARVAVGGLGGVGGSHLLTLARLGIGAFSIADIDAFELSNLNRQAGATCSTLGRSKIEVMAGQVRDINPEVDLRLFPGGVTLENVDEFLEGVDLYMDSLDLFALDVRRRVFARCRELGIPALTAAPMGMGTALLVFTPHSMSFEDYFAFDEGPLEDQIVRFVIGVSPTVMQRRYLVFRRSVDFTRQKVPSIAMGIEIAAGVACTAALKLLLGRGEVPVAPRGLHFDAYLNRLRVTWRPWGNRNPLQRLMYWRVKRMIRAVWGER
ncbi:MAG TPA: ThiF family adenylyltransferase [Chromatiales bacterium]|nr:ThiF family adenylyltransferase [Chromatiales bacterium]